MRVNEIFGSIDGEGIRAGELTTFIRLAGCNLRCCYCDTPYALSRSDGEEMSVKEIIEKVVEIGFKNVTITGGEPLLHVDISELIDALISRGCVVNIETNGSVKITEYLKPGVIITMDWKTPYSGECGKMLKSNLAKLREEDVLKIVLAKEDLSYVRSFLETHPVKSYIYLSPVFGKIKPAEIVDFMRIGSLAYIPKLRVQLQLHKYIWDPEERGV